MTEASQPAQWSTGPVWFRRPGLIMAVMGIVIVLAATVGLITVDTWGSGLGAYGSIVVSLIGSALVWRLPWTGLIVTAAAPLLAMLTGNNPIVTWNIALFVTFIGTLRGLPGFRAGALVFVSNFVAVFFAEGMSWVDPSAVIAGPFAFAAAAAGTGIRAHHRYWAELEHRTQQALATRDAEAERRVAEERLRIARDLHDVVGHEIAVVSMHLGAAEVHLPDTADDALRDLEAARKGIQAVLAETQQILEILRVDGEDENLAPAAGYARIPDLIETFRAAGLDIDATIADAAELPTLSPQVGTAAYRITQEALTNAQRHGTGAASVRIAVRDSTLTIETVNVRAATDARGRARASDRPARVKDRGGFGLVGMRERAASVGGRVDVQTDPDDTLFWVRAALPLQPAAPTDGRTPQ